MKETKTLWIARDKDGDITIVTHKQILRRGLDFWLLNTKEYPESESMPLPKEWFPEVTWENSPKQVELKIID